MGHVYTADTRTEQKSTLTLSAPFPVLVGEHHRSELVQLGRLAEGFSPDSSLSEAVRMLLQSEKARCVTPMDKVLSCMAYIKENIKLR